ncbi:MAG: TRAP transporter large permease subunit [Gammaproteobacteria bacterium]|nr:TRAP transporter large permease subunit [Gammaproteobacteria bacterium]
MEALAPILLFALVFALLLLGYPVALTLAGGSFAFALACAGLGIFDLDVLGFLPGRLYGIIANQTLIAVPLFVFMGAMLERTRIAEQLLRTLSGLLGGLPGGLGLGVILMGALMAASTGIVGATVVTLGLMALPNLLRQGYDPRLATGTISATGALGQIIPPSIALVLLGDVLSNAYSQAQLAQGVFAPKTVSIGDLFAGSLLPGAVLVALYALYLLAAATLQPQRAPAQKHGGAGPDTPTAAALIRALVAPMSLILVVLGSILAGLATPTEAAGVGALGAMLLALANRTLNRELLRSVCESTLKTTAMVFFILIGASVFALVFRGLGGDVLVQGLFEEFPGGALSALIAVMLVIFLLGFVLDFIEITFVVIPVVGPGLLALGIDPIWLGVLIAVNLQTSFLTPPFGFALFYLRGVTPKDIPTAAMYRGVVPFVALQLVLLMLLFAIPSLATWLPSALR